MKSKVKSIVALGLIVMCMNSCIIYSLFPIWTEDTLVYFPELEGKWQNGDDPDDYFLFEPGFNIENTIRVNQPNEDGQEGTAKVTKNFSITIGDDDFIVQQGDTIRDKEKITAYYEKEMNEILDELGDKMVETAEVMAESITRMYQASEKSLFYKIEDQSYTMTAVEDGQERKYQVHLARIGEDIFLDLFAAESKMANEAFESMVWFPVHMFMKLELDGDKLTLTMFDLDKMSALFESNLIRMDHENVDGSVLITAKSEELQKFLNKYSNDESVFEKPATYRRVNR